MDSLRKYGIGVVDVKKTDLIRLKALLILYDKLMIERFEKYRLEEFLNPSTKKITKQQANRENNYLYIKYVFANPGRKEKKAKVYLIIKYIEETLRRPIKGGRIKKTIERYKEIDEFEIGTKKGSQEIADILLKNLKKKMNEKRKDKTLWKLLEKKLKEKGKTGLLKVLD